MGSEWDLGNVVKPDIMTLGKAISAGISPVSGIVANDSIMEHIFPGDHGSTYGGNAFGMAVAHAAVKALIDEKMTENSLEVGNYFSE
jgi:ornithine--oxo-acid transaminase